MSRIAVSLMVAATVLVSSAASAQPVVERPWNVTFDAKRDAVRGNKNALVTIVLFDEFQSPFSRRLLPTLDALTKKFGKQLRLVRRHNPLPFHREALRAAEASLCAKEQGKFWKYGRVLFANMKALQPAKLVDYAKKIGIKGRKAKAFEKCLVSRTYEAHVRADQKAARRVKATGVPVSFVNGRKVVGAKPLADFVRLVEDELAAAKRLKSEKNLKSAEVYDHIVKNGQVREDFDTKVHTIATAGAPAIGDPSKAKHVLVKFLDLQCPYCARMSGALVAATKNLPPNSAVVFKQFPLGFHKQARNAAIASLCAHAQGAYVPFMKHAFANYRAMAAADEEAFRSWAQAAGVNDLAAFDRCVESDPPAKQVDADIALAKKVGVRGTPTIYVDGRKYLGFDRSAARFRTMLTHGATSAGATGKAVSADLSVQAKACAADPKKCGPYAKALLRNPGPTSRYAKAAALYAKACDAGDGYSCELAADMYADGNGVPFDQARAKKLRAKAATLKPAAAPEPQPRDEDLDPRAP